jgi:hypothetical protein
VRWILPGQLDAAVAGWFGRFPATADSREDAYLVHPVLRGLSVKVRGGQALEVKQFHGSPGILADGGRRPRQNRAIHPWEGEESPPRRRHDRDSRTGSQERGTSWLI